MNFTFLVGSVIKCLVETAGNLLSRASVDLPGIPIDLPTISYKDVQDILFGVQQNVDIIITSSGRSDESVKEVYEILGKNGLKKPRLQNTCG